ncbi:UNKNOWN [Stylonychia lemnae]|uniref:Uncharacterized protein n=1 Tax=Stylonychia lemnae TaxID=5949 RepID=A0A078AEK6_STYLE|nr:UNKNOWN [Stylonychia lemnae]|eukprot:CDW79902.1 UNKNOWN [Stylonychia lemnae]
MGSKVRELQHQNVNQAKADSELINRFERTHGSNLEMFMPKKPPLQAFNSARGSFISNQCNSPSGGAWENLIEKTQNNQLSQTMKRGDYALSSRRESERVNACRTLDPQRQEVDINLQNNKVTGCSRQRNERNYYSTFKISEQNNKLPPKNPNKTTKSNIETQSSLIIGSQQNTVLRDKALGGDCSKNSSQVIKNMRDFRSSIDCLPGSTTCVTARNSHNSNKENINPQISRGLATSVEREDMGIVPRERLRSAKTYDRSMVQINPVTYTNITYQNQPKAEQDRPYEKGTKKFWDKTMEIKQQSSLNKAKKEQEVVPQCFSKGRKPMEIRDAFRSQIQFV